MAVQYYFDNLDPTSFQRLVNVLLNSRFGESVRLLPLRGKDGGRDAETAPFNPNFEFVIAPQSSEHGPMTLGKGRFLFQAKHHRMADKPAPSVRTIIVGEFESELKTNVLSRSGEYRVNHFFLVTNVPGTKESIGKIDEKRRELHRLAPYLHADVLWQEHLVAWLDQAPHIWPAFPELFAGNKVPWLAAVADRSSEGLSRSIRLALDKQFFRDAFVRFRQINLEKRLMELFVDLDVRPTTLADQEAASIISQVKELQGADPVLTSTLPENGMLAVSALAFLATDLPEKSKYLLLEGGPGQGKSTITQMLAQLYRSLLLDRDDEYASLRRLVIKARLPIRIELKLFAEWLGGTDRSVEQYVAEVFSRDAGGHEISVRDIHSAVEEAPVLLMFDGLDEVGSDDLRDTVIEKIVDCVRRLEGELRCDLRSIVTSRPPAIAGRVNRFQGFMRSRILPLSHSKIEEFSKRWTTVLCSEVEERERVLESFNKRRHEDHVRALAENPMQLSVLLHFIRLKGEAFPDRRAELYQEYFKTVIDRDVLKYPKFLEYRDDIEDLHEVIGFEIHSRAEGDAARSSLTYQELLTIVENWLATEGRKTDISRELFQIGQERLGLIVALSGEGTETRHGFEIQPVREYFAAAYINDKCEGDAHEIFQAMIRRSFWREVALFLAGLRRDNEKADLLSRARELDSDPKNGWLQQGRSIVLQLLQEGVLTNPGHVYRDALSFLLEALNVKGTRGVNEGQEVIFGIPRLMRRCDSEQHRIMIEDLLEGAISCDDQYVLYKLYAIANQVLSQDRVAPHIARYRGSKPELRALVKLLWPAQQEFNLDLLVTKYNLLPATTDPKWAAPWFDSALINDRVTALGATPDYHELLLEQFSFIELYVFSQRFIFTAGSFQGQHNANSFRVKPRHPYAVWVLLDAIRTICNLLLMGGTCDFESTGLVDYAGLEEDIVQPLKRIVEASVEAASSLGRDIGNAQPFRLLLNTLREELEQDGLISWIACRCAIIIMQTHQMDSMWIPGRSVRSSEPPFIRFLRLKEWVPIRILLRDLYGEEAQDKPKKETRSRNNEIWRQSRFWAPPCRVRVAGRLRSIPEMLVEEALLKKQVFPSWIERVPIAHHWVTQMIRENNAIEQVLPIFAKRPLRIGGLDGKLTENQIMKLMSLANDSEDSAVLAGALFALMAPRSFERVDTRTALKMIESDSLFQDIASNVFQRGPDNRRYASRLVMIAKVLVNEQRPVSNATSAAAASFLAANLSLNLPPLRSLGCVKRKEPSFNFAQTAGN